MRRSNIGGCSLASMYAFPCAPAQYTHMNMHANMHPHTCKTKLTAPNVDVAVDLAELSEAEQYVSL